MRNGFTLLELLVVLTVVGLLAALAPPYLGKALLHFRAEGVADDLSVVLMQAHDLAMARNRIVRVAIDETRRNWRVDGRYSDRLPDGVAIAGPQADILFYPDGSSTGGQVVVSAGNEAWSVAVELLTGGVRRRHASAY